MRIIESSNNLNEEVNLISKRDKIQSIVKDLDLQDRNWKWRVKSITKDTIKLFWEYLEYLEEPTPYFIIQYDEEFDFYYVFDESEEEISEYLEYTDDLESVIRSTFYYAQSRY